MFLCLDHFDSEFKKKFYYLWIKVSELLLILGYNFYLRGLLKRVCFIMSGFYFIRVIWQIFEIIDYETANKVALIDILFSFCLVSVISISLLSQNEFEKRIKNGRD
jgi:hypothetical protein